jgi:hypothetical protein
MSNEKIATRNSQIKHRIKQNKNVKHGDGFINVFLLKLVN